MPSKRQSKGFRTGGSLDGGDDEAGTLQGAKEDGEPLPPSSEGGDLGRGILRTVRPPAGGVLRDRRAYAAGGGAGPTQQGAGQGAGENAAGSRGKYGSQSGCRSSGFGLDAQRNHSGYFDSLSP